MIYADVFGWEPRGRFSTLDIFTVGTRSVGAQTLGVGSVSRREGFPKTCVSVGIGTTLLVVELSSLEDRPRGV